VEQYEWHLPTPQDVRKVFIRYGLGLDIVFCALGKVLILLGLLAAILGKVFIPNN
jgi:hypothetical protein